MIIFNSWARFHYSIISSFEAGIMLLGNEVKSVKKGQMNLKGSYVSIRHNEAWLLNAHISPYQKSSSLSGEHHPTRERKLLLSKKEIRTLLSKTSSEGLTIVPIKVYTKHGLIKVQIALVRGKKNYDKRSIIKKREIDRSIRSALKYKK